MALRKPSAEGASYGIELTPSSSAVVCLGMMGMD
jgi:hypothetical protein